MDAQSQITLLENELDIIYSDLENLEERMQLMRERQNIIHNIIEMLKNSS